jgi:hypothetical protein
MCWGSSSWFAQQHVEGLPVGYAQLVANFNRVPACCQLQQSTSLLPTSTEYQLVANFNRVPALEVPLTWPRLISVQTQACPHFDAAATDCFCAAAVLLYCCTAAAAELLARHTAQLYMHLKRDPAFAVQQQQQQQQQGRQG